MSVFDEEVEKSNPYPRAEHGQWGRKPDLKEYNNLKSYNLDELKVCTKHEFSVYIDMLKKHDYKNIPKIIKLPNIKERLAKKMGLNKPGCYFTKDYFTHIRQSRKATEGQLLRDEEYKRIPEVIHNSNTVVWDIHNKNFFIPFEDRLDSQSVNKIIFTKDKLGNLAITVAKMKKAHLKDVPYKFVGIGVAPTIYKSIFGACLPTRLVASPTHESILPQFTKKSIKNSFVEINIKDVTEGNKQAKIDCLEKAFYEKLHFGKALVEYVPDDNTKKLKDIVTLKIRNFDGEKLNKAVRTLSFSLDTPLKTPKGELFAYKSQEDLTNKITAELTEKTKVLYSFLIGYFGLPEMRIVTKADLTYKGKVLYSPETGKPITQKEWKDFVDALERFLNRNYNGMGEKIVLSSEALGRILERMLKTNTLEAIREKRLDDIKYKSHNLEWISDSVKNMTNTFGESLSRYQQARIQVMTHSAAQRIQSVTDAERNKIQQILIDGVKNRQSKSVISQSLFDSCVGMNRDFQRIADSEIQDAAANAYIQEAVYNSKQGEKVYFKRFEMLDDNTCPRCKALRGMVVLYSDNPLPSSKIKDEYADYAIWEGSGINNKDDIPIGIAHPWCRGSWYRYYPEVEEM